MHAIAKALPLTYLSDGLRDTLAAGGEKQPCGWLKDRFGVSWRIIPTALGEMMTDPESGNPAKVMEALLTMSRIDIKALERAYATRR